MDVSKWNSANWTAVCRDPGELAVQNHWPFLQGLWAGPFVVLCLFVAVVEHQHAKHLLLGEQRLFGNVTVTQTFGDQKLRCTNDERMRFGHVTVTQ